MQERCASKALQRLEADHYGDPSTEVTRPRRVFGRLGTIPDLGHLHIDPPVLWRRSEIADRLEGAVLDRLRAFASDPATIEALTAESNRQRVRDLPKLRKQREALTKQLPKVAADADRVLTEWSAVPTVRAFVEDRLGALSARRDDLHHGIADLDRQIAEIESATAIASTVCDALRHVDEVYECLHPHERKELFKLLLRRVEVGERQITLEIYAGTAPTTVEEEPRPSGSRFGPLDWLPDEDSNLEPCG